MVELDRDKVISEICRFEAYVLAKDGKDFVSFCDTNSFLGREENYKSRAAEKARETLKCEKWQKSWIGTGKIANCAVAAMNEASNLIHYTQKMDFQKRLNQFMADVERVLYDIYCGSDEKEAFDEAKRVFGARYATIAFLFFIKDSSRFLPISPEHFDQSYEALSIEFNTSRKCSWDNYNTFNELTAAIMDIMEECLKLKPEVRLRLIDAHSFLWVIQQSDYRNWKPDEDIITAIESRLEGDDSPAGRKMTNVNVYARRSDIVREAKKKADGICQLCKKEAPFYDKQGKPYLEVHHIVWLSRGGRDSINNTVALCPNCHRRMHILDDSADIEKLQKDLSFELSV